MILASATGFQQITGFQHNCLPPARSFKEATAKVEAALGQLRNAEAALERQLSSLQEYIATSRQASVKASAPLTQ